MIKYFLPFLLAAFVASPRLQAQDNSYFQGSLYFQVTITGTQAEAIMLNEPNTKMLMHLSEGNYIVQLYGGRYPKTFIFLADSNYEYSMDMTNKRAFRFSSFSEKKENFDPPVAKPTGKTAVVNGITCEEYYLKNEGIEFLYYVNDDYRAHTAAFPEEPRTKASFLTIGLDGRIPLKTIKKEPGLIVETTLVKVDQKTLDPGQFGIPKGFEVGNRDRRY